MRILIADDDLVSRLAMEDVLRECAPEELLTAADGLSAWALLNGDKPIDLVCLDVRMPPPDGLQLAERIRASVRLRRLPVMLITSTADRDTAMRAARLELQGFVVKPVGAETSARIRRALDALDASILEPTARSVARLRIDEDRHRRYVGAFVVQVRALALVGAAIEAGDGAQRALFVQKAEACRNASLTLGAERLEQVIADALAAVEAGQLGAAAAMRQAVYWLERVAQARAIAV